MAASVERIRPSKAVTDGSSPLVMFARGSSRSSLTRASSLAIADIFSGDDRDLDAFDAGGFRAISQLLSSNAKI
jgi:hypothetical protein